MSKIVRRIVIGICVVILAAFVISIFVGNAGTEKTAEKEQGYTIESVNLEGELVPELPTVNLWKDVEKKQGVAAEVITRNNHVKVSQKAIDKTDTNYVYFYITDKNGESGWLLNEWVKLDQ
jgi:hypothetical protein